MRVFREPDTMDWEKTVATAALGAMGGLALGALISRTLASAPVPRMRATRSRGINETRPASLQRPRADQLELDRLETAVLSEFLMDPVLRQRSIDIGAVSPGIIELSGTVTSEIEARRAVSLASSVDGVETVLNRMDLEDGVGLSKLRSTGALSGTFSHSEARVGGMGRRRQGRETDPGRPDDSQLMREGAMAAADREQWDDEGLSGHSYDEINRPAVPRDSNFSEDEMDNQDPHGKHAALTLDRPPEELNSFSRVGERPKPRTELRLERSGTSFEEPKRNDDR